MTSPCLSAGPQHHHAATQITIMSSALKDKNNQHDAKKNEIQNKAMAAKKKHIGDVRFTEAANVNTAVATWRWAFLPRKVVLVNFANVGRAFEAAIQAIQVVARLACDLK